MKQLYRKLKPGDCPLCGKGPVTVYTRDITVTVLDSDGNPMTESNAITSSIGYCQNCHNLIGRYERKLFKYYPKSYPIEITEDKSIPKVNYFGDTHNDKVQVIYDA